MSGPEPEPEPEPEPVYSVEAGSPQEASSQQGLAHALESVHEGTDTPGHYPAGGGPLRNSPQPLPLCESASPSAALPTHLCRQGIHPLLGQLWTTGGLAWPLRGYRKIPTGAGVLGGAGMKEGASVVSPAWKPVGVLRAQRVQLQEARVS